MAGYTFTYKDPKSDVVTMRHPEFPDQKGPLVFDRVRFRAMETMPRGVRMVYHWNRIPSNMTIVFEEPPTMRLIHYMKDEFYVPTPWVVYFLTVQNNRMWVDRVAYNTGPIETINRLLKIPVLPNIYIQPASFCKVCPASEGMAMLQFREGAIRYDLTIAEAIASFWASHFNEDITEYQGYLPMPFVGFTFTGMEALDEQTITEVPWAPGASVKSILSQMEYGTVITKTEKIHAGATSHGCLYQEFQTCINLDTFEEVIPSAPRAEGSLSHDEDCDCDDCYAHAEECDCDSCLDDE
jgi:hypothetical protein